MDEYDTELDFYFAVLDEGPPYDDFQTAINSYLTYESLLAYFIARELEATQAYLLGFD